MGCGSSARTLSKEDIEQLEEKTKNSKDKIKRWHKVFLKECPTGQLTKKKFVQVYRRIFPQGKSADFYDHMFRTFDKDESGSLSFVEFMLAIYVTDSGTPEELLELTFRLYDIDNNHHIESHEIVQILMALHRLRGEDEHQLGNLCEVQAKEMIAKMDLNNDKVLSKEEFIKGCMADKDIHKLLVGR